MLLSLGACKKSEATAENAQPEAPNIKQQADSTADQQNNTEQAQDTANSKNVIADESEKQDNAKQDREIADESAIPNDSDPVDWKSVLIDNIKIYNPSFTSRPPKEAFFNQVEVTENGIHTQTAVVKAAIQSVEEMECMNDACGSTIHFDNPAIPPAYVDQSLNLSITNLGDLDGDGSDEIGALPDWWTSNIHTYKILTLKNGQWRRLVPSPTVHLANMYEHPYIPAEKIPGKPGYIRIREYDLEEMEVVESEVKIPKL